MKKGKAEHDIRELTREFLKFSDVETGLSLLQKNNQ